MVFKEKDNAAELPDDVNKYRNSQSQIGSKLEANMTFNINRNVSWTSRFYYFTDYHRITGEFENTFKLADQPVLFNPDQSSPSL